MKIYTIDNFLSDIELKRILEYSLDNLKLKPARIMGENKTIVDNLSIRKSSVAFYDYFSEFLLLKKHLEKEIINTIKVKGFDIDLEKELQFTQYKTDEFYDWHTDTGDLNQETQNRYCSIVILLNDNFEGGDLEVIDENGNEIVLKKQKGNLFIFPSEYIHRVTTITNGIRYSIVGWFSLKPIENFKKTII